MSIENMLATGIGFVTRPVGAAITVAALAAVVGGGVAAKSWWDGIQQLDETVEAQAGTIIQLEGAVRQAAQAAVDSRRAFEARETDLLGQINIANNEARASRARAARLARTIEELQHVETGPLSPVLVRALDSVRDDLRGFSPA